MTETAFTRLVGCRVPIQQAGMGATAGADLVTAVCAAGACGMLGSAGMHRRTVRAAVDAVAACSPGPFGVNFLVPFVDPAVVEEVAPQVKLVEYFYGEPNAGLVELAHSGGALAGWQVGSADEASAAAGSGCDLVVVQGVEAGGHVRGTVGLLPLLDAVLEAVDVPVVAAGGIGSARAVAAVLAAGAAAARVGTRFLAAREADVHDSYRAALIDAEAGDTELTSTFNVGWDAPHRVLRSCIEAAVSRRSASPEPVGETDFGGSRIAVPPFSALHPSAATSGRIEAMALYAGQSVSSVRSIQSAAEIVEEMSSLL